MIHHLASSGHNHHVASSVHDFERDDVYTIVNSAMTTTLLKVCMTQREVVLVNFYSVHDPGGLVYYPLLTVRMITTGGVSTIHF